MPPESHRTVEALLEGSEMTLKLLDQVLSRHGVTEINPQGEPFNPELHEAMAVIDAPDAAPNTVVTVVQPGFESTAGCSVRPGSWWPERPIRPISRQIPGAYTL